MSDPPYIPPTNIYIASSWKNEAYPKVLDTLRRRGFDCHDFRNQEHAFNWSEINEVWDPHDPLLDETQLVEALRSERADKAFVNDFDAMVRADACVLVLPSGRSAHIEAGWCIGMGKDVHVLYTEPDRPDLAHLLVGSDRIHSSIESLVNSLETGDA